MNVHKKGDLTIETVILAALALIFLIVVIFVITGKIGLFSTTVSSCENKGGICVSQGSCDGTESAFTCTEETDVCCLNTCKGKGGICKADCGDTEQIYFAACADSTEVCCKIMW